MASNESIDCSQGMKMSKKKLDDYISSFNKKKQLAWLNNTLNNSKAVWKIVFGHYPIFSNGIGHGNCKEMIDDVLPILLKNNVNIYLSGHDHNICYYELQNLHMIVSGNGAYSSTQLRNDSFFKDINSINGVCYLKFNLNKFEIGFFDLEGQIIYNTIINK